VLLEITVICVRENGAVGTLVVMGASAQITTVVGHF
jgi:hypothetical protein